MNKNYDLIIIGAGPSGVFTAYELIELGIAKDKKIKIYWLIVSVYWLTNFLSTLQK